MYPVSSAELASIRSDAAAAALDLDCDIQRKTLTSDGMGQDSETWTTIATVKAGMTEPSGSQLQNYDYLIGSLATWKVQLPYGTDVQRQDHLIIDGSTLVVQADLSPQSYNALVTVLASEVK